MSPTRKAHFMDPRIFCIGRNYVEHIRELGHPEDGDCVVFMKPATCLVPPGSAVSIPTDRGSVHHEAELVVRIGRAVRDEPPTETADAVDALALGLDLTLRDEQTRLRDGGKPWELAKAFDHSAPLGPFTPWRGDVSLNAIEFSCHVNGELRQQGNTCQMLFSIERIISILSRSWQLLPGDLIYTGTPAGVGALRPGDVVELDSSVLQSAQWPIVGYDALQKLG
ncbi:MAG: fumarylacetoacetate hydrolase family protein [Abyssibacter sp.]|nr:fumarylacetoacetate hydrolase family protein [Abyssibacter sp.]